MLPIQIVETLPISSALKSTLRCRVLLAQVRLEPREPSCIDDV